MDLDSAKTIEADTALLAEQRLGKGEPSIEIAFAGLALTLDHSGAIYVAAHETLIVSDLHFEKGSAFAAGGRLLPAFDTHDTLARLRGVIETYRPKRVICLGDSFHDVTAGERMAAEDRAALASIRALTEDWVWISGNHDPETPAFCEGRHFAEFVIGGAVLRHEPSAAPGAPQIAGHFHPKASMPAGGRSFSGRCFCASDRLLIMPAFGTYTGGLHCRDVAIRSLFDAEPRIYMIHTKKLWRIA
jgi:DNA ligase-associated metallophosphoesterase